MTLKEGSMPHLSAVGITRLQAEEDVKGRLLQAVRRDSIRKACRLRAEGGVSMYCWNSIYCEN